MLALTQDPKSTFLQRPHRILLTDAGQLGHGSDGHDFVLHRTHPELRLVHDGLRLLIFDNSLLDIGERFLPRHPLRTATRQAVAPYGPAFVGFHEGDAVFHVGRLDGSREASSWRPLSPRAASVVGGKLIRSYATPQRSQVLRHASKRLHSSRI